MKKERRNQNASWHFKIFGTLVITFFFYSPLKKTNGHNIRGKKQAAHPIDCRERLEKAQAFFFFFFFSFFWFLFPDI